MNDDVIKLFCSVDDFCIELQEKIVSKTIENPENKKQKFHTPQLCESEIMTIIISFQTCGYRTFKQFYLAIQVAWKKLFPKMPSYNRFVELMPRVLVQLTLFLFAHKGKITGISFIDSTVIKVCNVKRAKRNKVFKNVAAHGKSTMSWFFGFKLHIVINEVGELLAFKLTSGNTDDRAPVKYLTKDNIVKCFGDKGYISKKLFESLFENGLQLITSVKSNMKNKLMPMIDKILLRKRSLIETVNDQLKNVCQVEHTRHRSVLNFMVNMVAGLIAYARQERKPSLNFKIFEDKNDEKLVPMMVI
jgi:hypothetical protein